MGGDFDRYFFLQQSAVFLFTSCEEKTKYNRPGLTLLVVWTLAVMRLHTPNNERYINWRPEYRLWEATHTNTRNSTHTGRTILAYAPRGRFPPAVSSDSSNKKYLFHRVQLQPLAPVVVLKNCSIYCCVAATDVQRRTKSLEINARFIHLFISRCMHAAVRSEVRKYSYREASLFVVRTTSLFEEVSDGTTIRVLP